MERIRVVVSGAFGRMGREVVKAVVAQDDMVLVGVVDKVGVGEEIGQVCGIKPLGLRIREDLAAVLQESRADVMVDFTTPLAVME
ncbi:MAG: 4-hydroxy-tetrahydrodipicolinate reductase, partial [Firmicutes bacterium]|nr:4-hydroxy-tetrahydrodipicolinate reductase [Bacillota bacterium]